MSLPPGGARVTAFTLLGPLPEEIECGPDGCLNTGTNWVWAISNVLEVRP